MIVVSEVELIADRCTWSRKGGLKLGEIFHQTSSLLTYLVERSLLVRHDSYYYFGACSMQDLDSVRSRLVRLFGDCTKKPSPGIALHKEL